MAASLKMGAPIFRLALVHRQRIFLNKQRTFIVYK